MKIWIGTDEAGYGPNLGPLVIAATVWSFDNESHEKSSTPDFYQYLDHCITRSPEQGERLAMADSKQLYTPGKGLAGLEPGLLSALRVANLNAASWSELWQAVSPTSDAERAELPWHTGFDLALPLALPHDRIIRGAERLQAGLQTASVRLLGIEAVALFPGHFNRRVAATGSKGAVLSEETLHLIHRQLLRHRAGPAGIQCDKHGGRNRYAALLQQTFPDEWIEVLEEGRQQSRYAWGEADQRTEIRFTVHGEDFLPAALASMTAKYLRELAMLPFNQFWQKHLPGLKPTAGYPVDARRFQNEIADKQRELGIPAELLWRTC